MRFSFTKSLVVLGVLSSVDARPWPGFPWARSVTGDESASAGGQGGMQARGMREVKIRRPAPPKITPDPDKLGVTNPQLVRYGRVTIDPFPTGDPYKIGEPSSAAPADQTAYESPSTVINAPLAKRTESPEARRAKMKRQFGGEVFSDLFSTPISTASLPAIFSRRSDHPVLRLSIPEKDMPFQTNKFYSNMYLSSQDRPVFTYPYSVWYSKGNVLFSNGTREPFGLSMSHVDQNQREFGPTGSLGSGSTGAIEYYLNPIWIRSMNLGAIEFDSANTSRTKELTSLGPMIQLPFILTVINNGKLRAVGPFSGIVQIAKIGTAENVDVEAVLDATTGGVCTGAAVAVQTNGGSVASYQISYTRYKGTGPLLMFALPHHYNSFTDSTKAARRNVYQLTSLSKGMMIAVAADGWRMREDVANFGSRYYNDHHFYYSYFIHAAAVIAFLDAPTQGFDVGICIRSTSGGGSRKSYARHPPPCDQYLYAHLATTSPNPTNPNPWGIHPTQFNPNRVSSILFENKVHHTTYFGVEPKHIQGIHMLPLSPISPYIRSPAFAQDEWTAFFSGKTGSITDGWKGVLYQNVALWAPRDSWKFFAQSGFSSDWLDGGASRTWALAFAGMLGGA
ncbi:glycosyl hydrolase family 81-domain-containing protein [Terfezia claveryi]|nr:glycosyl hydrolase family 81-domain-containing protein [Terfezia claveryi]